MREAPALIITVPLEGTPTVALAAMYAEDQFRLCEWLERHPRWLEIIEELTGQEVDLSIALPTGTFDKRGATT